MDIRWVRDKARDCQHTVEGRASKGSVWSFYRDVTTWPSLDKGIEWVRLDGEFKEGISGTIKPVGQTQLLFRLTRVEANGGFSDEIEVSGPGVTVGFTHTLEPLAMGGAGLLTTPQSLGPPHHLLGRRWDPTWRAASPKRCSR
jgi:hypothetical protein